MVSNESKFKNEQNELMMSSTALIVYELASFEDRQLKKPFLMKGLSWQW